MWDIIHVGLIKLGELVGYQPGRDNVNVGGANSDLKKLKLTR